MKIHSLHPWNVTVAQAKAIQKNLRAWVITQCPTVRAKLIGRIEISCTQESDHSATVQSIITIKSAPSMTLLERKVALKTAQFPLYPGLCSFRKVPAIIAALNKLNRVPDVFLCDGRGITGPESFGVASHVGLITNIPTIGVRSIKPKDIPKSLEIKRGSWIPYVLDGQVGAVVRILNGLDPLLVSPAHKIGLQNAIELILDYIPGDTSAHDYLDSLYPESGNKADEKRPRLRLVTPSNR